jgi:hypothetical protein
MTDKRPTRHDEIVLIRMEGLKRVIVEARLSDTDRAEIEFQFDRALRAITKGFRDGE